LYQRAIVINQGKKADDPEQQVWPGTGRSCALTTSAAFADDQALIDALVRKGILSQKDAEQIESEVSKNPSLVTPPSSPLELAPWIKELKLGGNERPQSRSDPLALAV